jgi:putative autotransporter adhesin-like protein
MERRLNLFWPLTLIAAGIIWILIEAGRIPVSNLWALSYLWPVLLVAAGVGLILRPYWRYASAVLSLIAVAILFLGVLFAGQLGWNRLPNYTFDGSSFFGATTERGSGHVITENRTVQGFDIIHVGYPANVLVRQGASEALTIEGDDNAVAAIRTQVVGGVLEIDNQRDRKVYVTTSHPINITITVKDLRELDFDSAGQVTIQGLKTDRLKTLLDGAGTLTFDNLQVKSFDAGLSGAGSMHANGTVDTLGVSVDGLGSFDGEALHSQTATVTINGMGSANVWADGELSAEINGLGSVNYSGSAKVSKAVNGLGTINYNGAK